MSTIHPENAALIYHYQAELKHGRGYNHKTIDAALRHIWQFDRHTGSTDFRKVTRKMIADFKDYLMEQQPRSDGKALSASTIVHTFGNLKAFFEWLSHQDGYRRTISSQIYNHFSSPRDLVEIAGAAAPKFVPSVDQLKIILSKMPTYAPTQRRDRAMLAALFLFGVRDGALISLRLKHVDIDRKQVFQDAREVNTKFSKTSVVDWFPLGEEIETIVTEWIHELRSLGAGDDDPLCPTTPFKPWIGTGSIELEFLTTAAPVRRVLRKAASAAGVPYFKPHAIRSTVARLFDEWASSPSELKALSQNLGHNQIGTTLKYYGAMDNETKRDVIATIRERQKNPPAYELAERIRNAGPEMEKLILSTIEVFELKNK